MNEQNQAEQQLLTLKARIFDMNEQLETQNKMLQQVAEKLGYAGNSFEEMLSQIPEVVESE